MGRFSGVQPPGNFSRRMDWLFCIQNSGNLSFHHSRHNGKIAVRILFVEWVAERKESVNIVDSSDPQGVCLNQLERGFECEL